MCVLGVGGCMFMNTSTIVVISVMGSECGLACESPGESGAMICRSFTHLLTPLPSHVRMNACSCVTHNLNTTLHTHMTGP